MDRPLTSNIQETLRNIRPPSAPRDADTVAAFAQLGELGRLGGRIGRIYRGREVKVPLRKLLFIAAADHGASTSPRKSTADLVRDLLEGRTVISTIIGRLKTRTVVADFGVRDEVEPPAECWAEFVRTRPGEAAGTEDLTRRAAMSRETALASVRAGTDAMKAASSAGGVDLVGTGALGEGGELAACAIAAVLTGEPVRELTGRAPLRPCGASADAALRSLGEGGRAGALAAAVQQALDRPSPDPSDAVGVLSEYGGLEIGGLVGACLAAAELGIPVVLDGVVSTAAAAVALDLAPALRSYFLASDRAALPAHGALLDYLGARPLLALGFDSGEGEGAAAALAMELVDVAWELASAER